MNRKILLSGMGLGFAVVVAAYFLSPRAYLMAEGVSRGCVKKFGSPRSLALSYSGPPYSCRLYSDGDFYGGNFLFLTCQSDANDIYVFSSAEQCKEFQKLKPHEYIQQVLQTLVAPNRQLQPSANAPAE